MYACREEMYTVCRYEIIFLFPPKSKPLGKRMRSYDYENLIPYPVSHLPKNRDVYLNLSPYLKKVGDFSVHRGVKILKTILECLLYQKSF